jgi:hypothetical protein
MSGLLKAGLVVLAVSVIGAAANLGAREAFPAQWGGPNIGGGMLQLLFYLGAFVGAVLTVIGLVTGRPRRDS